MKTNCWEWLQAEINWLGWLVLSQQQAANSGLPNRLIHPEGMHGSIKSVWASGMQDAMHPCSTVKNQSQMAGGQWWKQKPHGSSDGTRTTLLPDKVTAQNSKVKWLAWSPVSPSVSAPVPSTECSSGPGLAVQIRSKAHLRRAAYCTTVGDSSLSFLFTSTRQCLQFVVAVSNTFVCLFVQQEPLFTDAGVLGYTRCWGLQGALSWRCIKTTGTKCAHLSAKLFM